jgi:glucose-1-phosphate thymidylyltransferase
MNRSMAGGIGAEIVGLVPAAGLATRLAPLPCSKELLPVGLRGAGAGARPKVVSEYLLDGFRAAGVEKVFFVVRDGKWDIPGYYRDGGALGLDIAYVLMKEPFGPAYTLDSAHAFVRGAQVAVGFPDIICEPLDAFCRARAELCASGADAVLGLFPAPVPHPCDRVRFDGARVVAVEPKPDRSDVPWSWAIAVWSPRFTEFLHAHLAAAPRGPSSPEASVGHVVQAAVTAGLDIRGVPFADGSFLDIGTPEGLREAMLRLAQP